MAGRCLEESFVAFVLPTDTAVRKSRVAIDGVLSSRAGFHQFFVDLS